MRLTNGTQCRSEQFLYRIMQIEYFLSDSSPVKSCKKIFSTVSHIQFCRFSNFDCSSNICVQTSQISVRNGEAQKLRQSQRECQVAGIVTLTQPGIKPSRREKCMINEMLLDSVCQSIAKFVIYLNLF